ncbi:MAG: arsenic transporter [Thermoplasmata archaeon]
MLLFRFSISVAVFAFTLLLVIIKPRNIGIGYSALIGAALSLALGISSVRDIVAVWDMVWNPTFTFVAIIIMSLIFDYAGFFEYYAIKIAKFAKGNGVKLFILVILLGSLISAIFANDGTALILTPIVYSILVRTGMDNKHAIPYVIATGFIADSSSLPFMVSNLVNIIGSQYFYVTFARYAETMIIPDLVSIAASLTVLYFYYRKSLPRKYNSEKLPDEKTLIVDKQVFRLAFPFIIILIIAYFLTSFDSIPISFVALPAALIILFIAKYGKIINTKKVLREAPWQIVIFSFGMYIVVYGMGNAGLTQILTYAIASFMSLGNPFFTVLSGLLFGFMAAIMNNLPSVMMGDLTIAHFSGNPYLVYSNVIGNDIGPKFTPIGSLATLLWLYTLNRKKGISISSAYYMKVGFLNALPVLVITLLSLFVVIKIGL